METKFNFKSQICTTMEQSERLIALGLKKETADCCWTIDERDTIVISLIDEAAEYIVPAWSLHRLILLCKYNDDDFGTLIPREGTYDYLIESIAYRIKEGYFNKEYLEE